MKIYVASSWRNKQQQTVVQYLRVAGHDVYDYRHPTIDNEGLHWSDIDEDYHGWNAAQFRESLEHDIANVGFQFDYNALQWADACVLVLPCGRSAHLEAGWAIGQGKPTCILLDRKPEPELMYKMADALVLTVGETMMWAEIQANRLAIEGRGLKGRVMTDNIEDIIITSLRQLERLAQTYVLYAPMPVMDVAFPNVDLIEHFEIPRKVAREMYKFSQQHDVEMRAVVKGLYVELEMTRKDHSNP